MAENWHSLVYFLVEKFCFINRQIDAAVAAGILVDGSAEFTSPACVMETDAAVEWHPIVYVTFIFICASSIHKGLSRLPLFRKWYGKYG